MSVKRGWSVVGLVSAVLVVGVASAIQGDVASAHVKKLRNRVAFVPASEAGTHAVQVRSKKKACIRERHVTWYRPRPGESAVIVYAYRANEQGLAEPRQPFPAEPGDYAVIGKVTVVSRTGHKHVCKRASTGPFAG